jgi:hypothetical protein
VVLVIDDADSLPRQSLYYLAQMQMLNVLAMDAPALQIVFAARPALLERLSHFETFRNRITPFWKSYPGSIQKPAPPHAGSSLRRRQTVEPLRKSPPTIASSMVRSSS